jgi:hypothetical protein
MLIIDNMKINEIKNKWKKLYILLFILHDKSIIINIITFKNDFPNFWIQFVIIKNN